MSLHPKFIKTEQYRIRAYEIDNQKKVTVPALVKLMHEAALENSIDLKLSVWDLEPHGVSWVLMRKKLEIHQLPDLGETIKVVTHCAGFEKFFTYRDYKVYNTQNELIASAASTWLIMDIKKRRMARIPDYILALKIVPKEEDCLPRPKNKLLKFETADLQNEFRVDWYDLDFNQHLNNIYYLQWVLETVPDELLKKGKLLSMDIIYKLESKWKEEIICETQIIDKQHLLHRLVRKSDGKQLSLAETKWVL